MDRRADPDIDEEITRIVLALIAEQTSVPDFLAAAAALRQYLATAEMPGTSSLGAPGPGAAALPSAAPGDPRVDAAVGRLQRAGPACLRLHELEIARELCVDPAHLGRLLRRHTGWTFRQWRFGICLRAACRGLAKSGAQIKAIARDCGFASSEQLAKTFRKTMGLTPTECRRMLVGACEGKAPGDTGSQEVTGE